MIGQSGVDAWLKKDNCKNCQESTLKSLANALISLLKNIFLRSADCQSYEMSSLGNGREAHSAAAQET